MVFENEGNNFQCKYEISCNFGARIKDCICPRTCCGPCKQTTFKVKNLVRETLEDYETANMSTNKLLTRAEIKS